MLYSAEEKPKEKRKWILIILGIFILCIILLYVGDHQYKDISTQEQCDKYLGIWFEGVYPDYLNNPGAAVLDVYYPPARCYPPWFLQTEIPKTIFDASIGRIMRKISW